VRALAALRSKDAIVEATTLARAWLAPATSTSSVNQVLPRAHVLRSLDEVLSAMSDPKLAAVREEVARAPEPDVFVPDGGDFF
jgi:hypothetical protein